MVCISSGDILREWMRIAEWIERQIVRIRQIVKASEVKSGDSSSDRQFGRHIVRSSEQATDLQTVRSSDRSSDRATDR